MDFKDYKIKLNIKSMMLFEQMTGKSFLECKDEDVFYVMYSCFVVNNPQMIISYDAFLNLIEDKKVASWLITEYKRITDFNSQLKWQEWLNQTDGETDSQDDVRITITEIASLLIVQYHIDATYVLYDMGLWEIQPYIEAGQEVHKQELIENRLFTYLTIAPHIDTRKCKSPESLFRFGWEVQDRKKAKEQELNSMTDKVKEFFNNNNLINLNNE